MSPLTDESPILGTTFETPIPEFRNPLHGYMPSKIADWSQWLELWNSTSNFDLRVGLLHRGFEVQFGSHRGESFAERVAFYLQLADGYRWSMDLSEGLTERWYGLLTREQVKQLRQQLAEKALGVLVQSFFSWGKAEKADDDDFRAMLTRHPALIDAVLWFFRPIRTDRINNLSSDDRHIEDVLVTFIKRFYRAIWQSGDAEKYGPESSRWERSDQALYYHLVELRPRLLPLIAECEELDLLLRKKFAPDEACLAALCERVFGETYLFWDGETRNPRTLPEALWAGSKIARILILLEQRATEEARQIEIGEARQAREEAEERLAALAGGNQDAEN